MIQAGHREDGYEFQGGDPARAENWRRFGPSRGAVERGDDGADWQFQGGDPGDPGAWSRVEPSDPLASEYARPVASLDVARGLGPTAVAGLQRGMGGVGQALGEFADAVARRVAQDPEYLNTYGSDLAELALGRAIEAQPRRRRAPESHPGPSGFTRASGGIAESGRINLDAARPEGDLSMLQTGALNAAHSLGVMAPSLLAGSVGGTPAALSAIGASTFGDAYSEARAQGRTPAEAARFAAGQAAVEVGTEMLPTAALLKAGEPLWKRGLEYAASEIPGELLATTLQGGQETLEGLRQTPTGKDATLSDFVEGLPGELRDTVVSTLMTGGVTVPAAHALDRARAPSALGPNPVPVIPESSQEQGQGLIEALRALRAQGLPAYAGAGGAAPATTATPPVAVKRPFEAAPAAGLIEALNTLQPEVAPEAQQTAPETRAPISVPTPAPQTARAKAPAVVAASAPSEAIEDAALLKKTEVLQQRARAARARYAAESRIDPVKDGILAAIAKLGGWNRAEAEAQGIDPAEFGRRGWRIKKVFTSRGDTADGLAERLNQYGYPVTDENGNYTANALLAAVDEALHGRSAKQTAQGTEAAFAAATEQSQEDEAAQPLLLDDDEYDGLQTPPEPVTASGVRSAPLQAALQRVLTGLTGAPQLQVVQSIADLPPAVAQAVQTKLAAQPAAGANVEGVWAGDRVWLVADNIANLDRAIRVFLHEVVGHGGVRSLFNLNPGDTASAARFNELLDDIVAAYRAGKFDQWFHGEQRHYLDLNIDAFGDAHEAAEEFLARLAESLTDQPDRTGLLDRARRILLKFLRSLPGALGARARQMTRADIDEILRQAVHRVERGPAAAPAQPRLARDASDRSTQDLLGGAGEQPADAEVRVQIERERPLFQLQGQVQPREGRQTDAFKTRLSRAPSDRFKTIVDRMLREQGGAADAALFNIDVGPIDLIYGEPGSRAKSYADGYGLSHILAKHPEIEPYALEDIVASAHKAREKGNTIELETPDHLAIIKLDWRGTPRRWLLTAFETNPARAVERIGGNDPTVPEPPSDQVAESADRITDPRLSRGPQRQTGMDGEEGGGVALAVSPRPPAAQPAALGSLRRALDTYRTQIGEPAYNALAYWANRLLWSKIGLAPLSPELRQQLREYRAEIGRTQRQVLGDEKAPGPARQLLALPGDERALISDVIEGEMKAGDVPPQRVHDTAMAIAALFDRQSRALVDAGMLSEDARERWEGKYLPRYYGKHEAAIGGALNHALRRAFMKIDGRHFKGRGLFERVAVAEVPKFEALGWQVREPVQRQEPVGKSADTVLMWRDYTPDERAKMGEIRDAGYRFLRGYLESAADLAKGKLYQRMARDERMASKGERAGWVQVPDTKIPDTGGVRRYGAMSGLWTTPEVMAELEHIGDKPGALAEAYLQALSYWKEGKTALNPVVHGNNIVSNVVAAHYAGVPVWDPRAWRNAAREYFSKGKLYREALDAGLFGTEFYGNEIRALLPDLSAISSVETAAASNMQKVLRWVYDHGPRQYREAMGRAYQAEDQFFKMMLYQHARQKMGMTTTEAIDYAERYLFNYAELPKTARKLRAIAYPFISYTYKAAPMLAHTAMVHPLRLLAVTGIVYGLNALAYALLGDDRDEDDERKVMPDWMAGNSVVGAPKMLRMPWEGPGGEAVFMDISRRLPLGDIFDAQNQAGGIPLPAPLMPNNPLMTMAAALLWNVDTFTGNPLVESYDSGADKAKKWAGYFLRQVTPNTPLLPGSWSWDKAMHGIADAAGRPLPDVPGLGQTGQDYYGNPLEWWRAAADVLTGTKFRYVDVERERGKRLREIDRQLGDLRADQRATARNQGLSLGAQNRQLDKFIEQRARLQQQKEEFAR